MDNAASLAAFGMPQGWEWILILAIAVLIFGRRLPEIARGIGKSITEFKKGVKDTESDVKKAFDDSESAAEEQTKKKNESRDNEKA